MSDYVMVNGGRLEFDIGVTKTMQGHVGRVFMQGVEVYTTPPVATGHEAHMFARNRVVEVFAP